MTTGALNIPADVDDLTPSWFSAALGEPVTAVEVLDAHSGTTGRARVRVRSDALPQTLFVKLQPFSPEQRAFLRQVGLGVAEARLYANLGGELPVRIPRVWHSAYDEADGAFVMVLEDLVASGCRFPSPDDDDILDVAGSAMSELAVLHATYLGRDIPWLATPEGMRRKPDDPKTAARRTHFIRLALDQFGEEMGPAFRRLARLYIDRSSDIISLFGQGDLTLIHGDTHSGNLFVDDGRTGFYDWAVVGRGPGMRDVAYFLCNSLPTEVRRAEQEALLTRYRSTLAAHGGSLDERTAVDQYRLFSVYSWIAAVSTAAMGSQWQPAEIARAAMLLTTTAIEDLGVIELLETRLA
ncbi:phosphotransferase [Mycobacterium sp. CVI_P3]|uniref:Phosphotransferase n=1 Tax=Mycobacterium pinniadriaticum TaxID=2994102 RepID=A0ABT3S7Y2_9MYCO|nr:phosphotransferase [Mycobacterium pinniadriaticum]MCX2929190.1 phosphotransferase [Mycobacterium pinniadriaticum]MCX2935615.1 phosphotransferase [Mycobacterium pinniadriaticum]